MPNGEYSKRRILFIEPKFQIRFITRIFLFILAGSLITAGAVFYTGWTEFGDKLAAVYPQGRLVNILYKVNLEALKNLLLALPVLLYISMRISHRIAGPIYRIKKELSEIAKGNLDKQVKLRKRDELQDVAEAINQMLQGLSLASHAKQEELLKIEQDVSDLEKVCLNERVDIDYLRTHLSEVGQKLRKLKVKL